MEKSSMSAEKGIESANLGLHAAVIPQADLETGLRAAARAGFTAFEPEAVRIAGYSRARLRAANELRTELGLRWGPLNELQAFGSGTADDDWNRRLLDLAAELQVPALTVIPAPADLHLDQAVAELGALCEQAAQRSLFLCFEMLCFQDRPFHNAMQTLQLAEAVGARIVIDTFHYIVSGATAGQIRTLHPERIGVVHISDAERHGRGLGSLVDEDRVLPGEGELQLAEVMTALVTSGYRGLMSVEVFHPRYARDDPTIVARRTWEQTVQLLSNCGWSRAKQDGANLRLRWCSKDRGSWC
jgi:4-hydroxyphenylpyruvate dioxygenase